MAEVIRLVRETAFSPGTIQNLAAAVDETWERLRESGSRLARPAYSRAMREVAAKRIIEMAQNGVEDREALVTSALQFVAANYAVRRTSEIILRLRARAWESYAA
jgi:hypothetical protein